MLCENIRRSDGKGVCSRVWCVDLRVSLARFVVWRVLSFISTTVTLAYLLCRFPDHRFPDLLSFLRAQRAAVNPNFGFMKQLQKFAYRC